VETLVEVSGLVKNYGEGTPALGPIDLSVGKGQFVSLVGPSGCGKTTLLRCIAGLENVSGGTIAIAGQEVSRPAMTLSASERGLGMVFQSYALWPHMRVRDIVKYPLRFQKGWTGDRDARALEMLDMLGIRDKADQFPYQLSGGQQQRVALARSLSANPRLVLFDEPLSNLDARLRDSMRLVIRDLARALKFTAVYVTHDRLEAMVMSDRIVILNKGRIIQQGEPQAIYRRPNSLFSARVLGDVNVFTGTVATIAGDRATVLLAGGILMTGVISATPVAVGDKVDVIARPTSLQFGMPVGVPPGNLLRGKIEDEMFLGETWRYRIGLPGEQYIEAVVVQRVISSGQVDSWISPDDVIVLRTAAEKST
jgi:iron(III) transport system ATP-binding protein